MTTEVQVGEHSYRVGKLNTLSQFHIVRRLAPIFAGLGESLKSMQDNPLQAIEPMTRAIAGLSDEDSNYVIFGCLKCVQRDAGQGRGWSAVTNSNQLMFQDIELPQMMELIWKVLESNLAGFLASLPDPATIEDKAKAS